LGVENVGVEMHFGGLSVEIPNISLLSHHLILLFVPSFMPSLSRHDRGLEVKVKLLLAVASCNENLCIVE
jgi:hypothetical protein